MSVWGKIGKGLLNAIPVVGPVLSGIAGGRAEGRVQEAQTNSNQDLLRQRAAQMLEDALQGRRQLDINQRDYQVRAPGMRGSNAVKGDAMAGLQDAGVSGPITGTKGRVPQITGGMRPSLLSGNTRQLGANMSRDALLQNMSGADTFEPLPAMQTPSITPTPQAGKLDKFLSVLGGIGSVAGAFGEQEDDVDSLYNRTKPNVPQIPGGYQIPQIPGRRMYDPMEEANF